MEVPGAGIGQAHVQGRHGRRWLGPGRGHPEDPEFGVVEHGGLLPGDGVVCTGSGGLNHVTAVGACVRVGVGLGGVGCGEEGKKERGGGIIVQILKSFPSSSPAISSHAHTHTHTYTHTHTLYLQVLLLRHQPVHHQPGYHCYECWSLCRGKGRGEWGWWGRRGGKGREQR